MEKLDNIRPLTPSPSPTTRDQRRPYRKPRQDRSSGQARQRPADRQEQPETTPPHIDEYA